MQEGQASQGLQKMEGKKKHTYEMQSLRRWYYYKWFRK